MLTEIEKAYLAGFFDGEGCVNITRIRTTLILRVMIVNTDISILKYIQSLIGGDITSRVTKDNWKTYNCWRTSGSRAIKFLSDIQPYLRVKNKQATLAFCFAAIQPGKGKGKMTPNIREGLELCERQLKWLNRKGIRSLDDIEPISVIMNDLKREGDRYAVD